MRLLRSQEIKVKRRSAGAYTNGEWVEGTENSWTIDVNVQPATPQQLLNLPEAQRTKSAIEVFTEELLKTADVSDKTSADRIEYNGRTYEVHKVTDWSAHTHLAHYEILAVEIDYKEADRKPS
jgi:hypothetical protein